MDNDKKYMALLAEKYPTKQSVCQEIINLNAIINLPKGTEHFMSDLHGEYEAFCHILNNCSGVVREKVERIFDGRLTREEKKEICTLIYYPKEKLHMLKEHGPLPDDWYRVTLENLLEIAKTLSSKYTRSKVRKAMPEEFAYIIDELLHMQQDEDNNQISYHNEIISTIISIENADEFIYALTDLIKRLAVDHLHIVGDIFDRGSRPDDIIDMLMSYHSLDLEWGNHDIMWMGAASGNEACVATAVRNNLRYNNYKLLESGYGISLRRLSLYAESVYADEDPMVAALKAISVILFKLEGQIIDRNPDYRMEHRKLLHRIDYERGSITIDGKEYKMKYMDFPTVDREHPYELNEDEKKIIHDLKRSFKNSQRLRSHIEFLYKKGSMYCRYNSNLLYHGCIPLDSEGNFDYVEIDGNIYKGKSYLDYAERDVRKAYFGHPTQAELDFMWYLWAGKRSPLSGRDIRTFEKMYLDEPEIKVEEVNPYYKFYHNEVTCNMILREFGLYSPMSHIINGHTPVRVNAGEKPVHANGKLIIIDGGFCKAYHNKTGIAGYTLIYNSHCMRLKAHQPFENIQKVLEENKDIESNSEIFEQEKNRVLVKDTDIGKQLKEQIDDLTLLLHTYK